MDPVLVVDDEADLVASYERLLRRQGYRVVPAGTCRAGLLAVERAQVERAQFCLVIADLRLPDGDGLEIVRAARALPAPPPVLVATALATPTAKDGALSAGATAFLAKPFAADAFLRLVGALVSEGAAS